MTILITLLICFGLISVLVWSKTKKQYYQFGIGKKELRDKLGKVLFNTEVKLIVSTTVIEGIIEMYIDNDVMIFTPLTYDILSPNDVVIIPLKEHIELYQTFGPIKWDQRNLLLIQNNNRISQFHSDRIFLRFRYSHELEIWYAFSQKSMKIPFPLFTPSLKIADFLCYITCLKIYYLNHQLDWFNSKIPFRFIPFFKIHSITIQTIPTSHSKVLTSFDSSIEIEMTFSSKNWNLFKCSFILLKFSLFAIPFTLRIPYLSTSFHLRMDQLGSNHCWLEILPFQFCVFIFTLGDYLILPLLSLILNLLLFILSSYFIGKVYEFQIKNEYNVC
ncbi:hypothetical protein EHI8A_201840 [Entamoeba histolytica HM-1:IMSS-B]|uniref:Uncharacterized protein n=6 Tax=Entamoeba histolytica TaxID=5759 RepID=C4LTH8_ENTH1|nr:hypothetical protein EHI_011820 [Entamoeba histolytica HM-1:IMSS]EMD42474.1 Hypothetical protein EHI5A_109980 [Entamoeba histolytica KU27]EMH76496.1 hypothetical protein EHI8A_201840 [Entamoeba histolytica HM-1:IMSS-B]EMS10921.1 hypothetical protein KM1_132180 [Entamoeba histolytica HM-3:IMSS]ENY64155.1 hypothetical protein EHI7A_071870 [Entamoeba histolytica HM-1:IMSS-A]GAT91869.1 hypothetical protein CL6EHI_011820 [Entamoeba histolytica]|eukprot:XP_653804.1 hypothetical protein EHI_011820 [Entamoeba histolytica HM-1:IMSS]